jgi:hypothetical protein
VTFGHKVLVLVACAAAAVGAACRGASGPEPPVLFEYDVTPRPLGVGPAVFQVKLSDISSKPLGGARVKLEGNMTHAGMEPVFADAEEVEPGLYRATLNLTMGGDWVVLVHAALPDGRSVEERMDVRNVSAD